MSDSRRVLVFQPALPSYRVDFFERIYKVFDNNFCLYYSPGSLSALTDGINGQEWGKCVGRIRRFGNYVEWQSGILFVPIRRGDVVVVSGGPRCLTNVLLLIKARLSGAKTVWWGHYWSSTSKKYRFWLRMWLMRLSHSVLFYTDMEVLEYAGGYGWGDSRPIVGLNNGLNVDDIGRFREKYSSKSRRNSVLFIGRLTKKARLDLLIKAVSDKRLANLFVDVIGGGEEQSALIALAEQLGVASRIIWHGEMVDEQGIALIANSCRYFAYAGSVGLSLIHAMAYGLPALVHSDRYLHMPEIAAFQDGVTGVSFVLDDFVSISNSLSDLQFDYARLDRMSVSAIGVVESQFNTGMMASRFCGLIERLKYS